MSLWDQVTNFLSLAAVQDAGPSSGMIRRQVEARTAASFTISEGLYDLTFGPHGPRPWQPATIAEAMSVPAIKRGVALIAGTMGTLPLIAYRNGVIIETPRQIARPDPYSIPRDTYRDIGYLMATRGEHVFWIASRDADNQPTAFVTVPPRELKIEDNQDNRLFPTYIWGSIRGTRYSAANPSGQFLHMTYFKEPGQLRGVGPLQICQAAVSVSVEAQEWAASFFADGGIGSMVIRSNVPLSGDPSQPWNEDPDDEDETISEADAFLNAWQSKAHNVPRVAGPEVGDIEYPNINPQGAQMLAARDYQNGDAARMLDIPGVLLEYSTAGSSLTYQNIADVYMLWIKSGLAPMYLEPVEQWMSDTLPRNTVVRFDVGSLERADAKTRFEVYQMAIGSGIFDAEYAAMKEGITPGSPDTAPIAPAPPAAVPTSIPNVPPSFSIRTAAADPAPVEVRCQTMMTKRRAGVVGLDKCNALLSTTGTFVGRCRRCKTDYPSVA